MIRMIQSQSSAQAKAYFREALVKSDYYINDQELQGKFYGRLADRLGIGGEAIEKIFFALAENKNPTTGKPLTPRNKADRTIGYDINFHCPKSVSVLHILSKDHHILKAFEKSVQETMQDIEKDSKTRVRTEGREQDRESGELVWAAFTHQTARPVGGHLPDPHLHSHCFVFNATWDEEEKRIKAAQFRDIKRDMPYYQARFHKRLADELVKLGYQVRPTKSSFEVKGIPQPVIDLFSKRTDEIGRVAKEKGITDAKELDELGARTRSAKQKGHSMEELKAGWRSQINALPAKGGKDENPAVRFAKQKAERNLSPELCVEYTLEHGFERASVHQDRRLLASAYQYSLGIPEVTIDAITGQFNQDARLIHVDENGKTMTTTRQVLAEEQRMVRLAKESFGKFRPLYLKLPEIKADGQQRDAIAHVLSTSNGISIVTGKAGTGKTTTLKELVPLIEQAGKAVTIVAPSADASRTELRQHGFQQANTLAKLLDDTDMQANLKNQVLIVDEAGMLGTQDMTAVLKLVNQQQARMILVGDTRQHSSVLRGDALRILNTVAGIKTAEISKIYRQKNIIYRQAVEDLSIGDVASAFEKLDEMGAIKTIDPLKPHEELVNDYICIVKEKKTALVISPTHQQSDEVTVAIREKLQKAGLLGKKEIEALRLKNLNLTNAQKGDLRNYKEGQVIQFNQNMKNIKRGSMWTVSESSEKRVMLQNKEKDTVALPVQRSNDFEVYEQSTIHLAKRDIIRITRNGLDKDKKDLTNRQLFEVMKVDKNGTIKLQNIVSKAEYEIDKDFGHLTHAYCITSYSSQGKNVDEVLIAQPAATFPATDSKQFYVSVSRGRERVRIYTDDKEELLKHAKLLGDRRSAIELVRGHNLQTKIVEHTIRKSIDRNTLIPANKKDIKPKKTKSIGKDYEPGI